ncbi:unnamed protein product [Trichogramma brassicae]|uniref:Uncharacterized protein n=1 Tax=Trichogramma brassicae TaxID=86971 RepID=A0A6H5ICL6_9HYME|nr:unnamed protein product [Trichogramma brassicae]
MKNSAPAVLLPPVKSPPLPPSPRLAIRTGYTCSRTGASVILAACDKRHTNSKNTRARFIAVSSFANLLTLGRDSQADRQARRTGAGLAFLTAAGLPEIYATLPRHPLLCRGSSSSAPSIFMTSERHMWHCSSGLMKYLCLQDRTEKRRGGGALRTEEIDRERERERDFVKRVRRAPLLRYVRRGKNGRAQARKIVEGTIVSLQSANLAFSTICLALDCIRLRIGRSSECEALRI